MRPGLILAESVLATVLFTAAANAQIADVSFDQSGRMVLAGSASAPLTQVDGDPPTGPPNIMCPC
jgi:hypothetical protein